MTRRSLRILGTRGIPAAYGGFETSAQQIAEYLVKRGWQVTVYCEGPLGSRRHRDRWCGIDRQHIPARIKGPAGSVLFDLESTLHVLLSGRGLIFTLGYNTGVFFLLYRLFGLRNIVNMDGFEWMRAKWSAPVQRWLRFNERAACRLGNHLIADHPEIERYLQRQAPPDKISMITYSARPVVHADPALLTQLDLEPGRYALVIARSDPDNSPLEIVTAYSRRHRGMPLVVLGNFEPETKPYHASVMAAAGAEVRFVGAIYRAELVSSLRRHACFYLHGHQRGGVNPSLVESMAAGTPVLALDNRFNRWTAGAAATYFTDVADLDRQIEALQHDAALRSRLSDAGRQRFEEEFTEAIVLGHYERLFLEWLSLEAQAAPATPRVD